MLEHSKLNGLVTEKRQYFRTVYFRLFQKIASFSTKCRVRGEPTLTWNQLQMATNIPNFYNMKEAKQFFKYLWRYSSWKCWPPVVRPKIKYCWVICPYPLACPCPGQAKLPLIELSFRQIRNFISLWKNPTETSWVSVYAWANDIGGNPQQPLKHRGSGGSSSRAFFIAGSEADQDHHHHQRSRHLLDTLEEVSTTNSLFKKGFWPS